MNTPLTLSALNFKESVIDVPATQSVQKAAEAFFQEHTPELSEEDYPTKVDLLFEEEENGNTVKVYEAFKVEDRKIYLKVR